MAFPTTGILDDFSPDDTHPMSGWTDYQNGIDATGGVGKNSAINSSSISYWNIAYGPLVSPGIEVYLTIDTKPSDLKNIAIYCVTDLGGGNGYQISLTTVSGDSNDTLTIYRVDGLSDTQLGSTITQEFGNGDKLGIEIIGNSNNIKAYRCPSGGSWAQIGSTQSDSTHCGAGVTGYPLILLWDSGTLVAAVDDFGGGTVVVAAATIEQEGFRFRNDDGSESAATWKANQDTNITLAADTAARIRMLLNATGDPSSIGAQLEYRYKPSGGAFGSWTKVN